MGIVWQNGVFPKASRPFHVFSSWQLSSKMHGEISDAEAKELAEGLQDNTSVNFLKVDVGPGGFRHFAELLKVNKTITSFSTEEIDDTSVRDL